MYETSKEDYIAAQRHYALYCESNAAIRWILTSTLVRSTELAKSEKSNNGRKLYVKRGNLRENLLRFRKQPSQPKML